MGTTSKRGYYYPDGNDEVSLFPDQHRVLAMTKIDTDMHTALTADIALSRIPNLPAGKTTSGRFADARIPTTVARTSETSALESRIAELESGPRSTGPRNVVDLIVSGVVENGSLNLIRINNTVTITTRDLRIDHAGWKRLINLPAGFRPPMTIETASWWTTDGELFQCLLSDSGGLTLFHPGSGRTVRGNLTYPTTDEWPSTLPGYPV